MAVFTPSKSQRAALARQKSNASRAYLLNRWAPAGKVPRGGVGLAPAVKAAHQAVTSRGYKSGDFFIPEVDIARRATRRGAEDLIGAGGLEGAPLGGDLGTRLRRLHEDLALGRGNLDRELTEGTADYNTNIAGIQRRFDQLALNQSDAGRAAGLKGGYQRAAEGTRAENQALTRAPVDTGFSRFREGLERARGELATRFERESTDIGTEAGRVRREGNIAFGDLDLQEIGAAIASGYQPGDPIKATLGAYTPIPSLGGKRPIDFKGQPFGTMRRPFVPGRSPGMYPGAPTGRAISAPGAITKADRAAAKPKKKKR